MQSSSESCQHSQISKLSQGQGQPRWWSTTDVRPETEGRSLVSRYTPSHPRCTPSDLRIERTSSPALRNWPHRQPSLETVEEQTASLARSESVGVPPSPLAELRLGRTAAAAQRKSFDAKCFQTNHAVRQTRSSTPHRRVQFDGRSILLSGAWCDRYASVRPCLRGDDVTMTVDDVVARSGPRLVGKVSALHYHAREVTVTSRRPRPAIPRNWSVRADRGNLRGVRDLQRRTCVLRSPRSRAM